MNRTHRGFALLLVLLMLTLAACGARSYDAADTIASEPMSNTKPQSAENTSMPAEEPAYDMVVAEETTTFSTTTSDALPGDVPADPGETNTPSIGEKIIYSGSAEIETTQFDTAIATLEGLVTQLNGFVESSNAGGNTRHNSDGTTALVNRWAYYTVRIPSASFNDFMSQTSSIGNVINNSRSAQNVTSQYTDFEARLSSLSIQEERLLAMLEKSGDLESLITLEQRLSEVRYEIESIERNLRNLDQRLAYSDVSLSIQEVEVYTPTVTITRSFGEKLSDAFADGWHSFSRGVQNFCIGLAGALPTLVLLLLIAAVAAVVLRKIIRRRKAAAAAQSAPSTQPKDDEKK